MYWKLTFGAHTIADDGNGLRMAFEDLGGDSDVQLTKVASGPHPWLAPRGNVGGQFALRVTKSHASLDDAWIYLVEQYALLNTQSHLLLTNGSTQNTFPNAILHHVSRVPRPESDGVKMVIRYVFTITSMTQLLTVTDAGGNTLTDAGGNVVVGAPQPIS